MGVLGQSLKTRKSIMIRSGTSQVQDMVHTQSRMHTLAGDYMPGVIGKMVLAQFVGVRLRKIRSGLSYLQEKASTILLMHSLVGDCTPLLMTWRMALGQ